MAPCKLKNPSFGLSRTKLLIAIHVEDVRELILNRLGEVRLRIQHSVVLGKEKMFNDVDNRLAVAKLPPSLSPSSTTSTKMVQSRECPALPMDAASSVLWPWSWLLLESWPPR